MDHPEEKQADAPDAPGERVGVPATGAFGRGRLRGGLGPTGRRAAWLLLGVAVGIAGVALILLALFAFMFLR